MPLSSSVLVSRDEVLRDDRGDAGEPARGDQAGALDREGPRGAARQGARRGRAHHRAGARGAAPDGAQGGGRAAGRGGGRTASSRRPRIEPTRCGARPRTTSTRSSRSSRSRCARSSRTRSRPRGASRRPWTRSRSAASACARPAPRPSSALAPHAEQRPETELFDEHDRRMKRGGRDAGRDRRPRPGRPPRLVAPRSRSSARSTDSRPSWSRCPTTPRSRADLLLESVVEGILVTGPSRRHVDAALRPLPRRVRRSRSASRSTSCSSRRPGRGRATTYPLDPERAARPRADDPRRRRRRDAVRAAVSPRLPGPLRDVRRQPQPRRVPGPRSRSTRGSPCWPTSSRSPDLD